MFSALATLNCRPTDIIYSTGLASIKNNVNTFSFTSSILNFTISDPEFQLDTLKKAPPSETVAF